MVKEPARFRYCLKAAQSPQTGTKTAGFTGLPAFLARPASFLPNGPSSCRRSGILPDIKISIDHFTTGMMVLVVRLSSETSKPFETVQSGILRSVSRPGNAKELPSSQRNF